MTSKEARHFDEFVCVGKINFEKTSVALVTPQFALSYHCIYLLDNPREHPKFITPLSIIVVINYSIAQLMASGANADKNAGKSPSQQRGAEATFAGADAFSAGSGDQFMPRYGCVFVRGAARNVRQKCRHPSACLPHFGIQ